MIYTGGTTGKSKGAVHTQRVHVAMVMAEAAEWDWPQRARFLAMTPISHVAGAMIVPVMLRSGTFVMSKGFDAQRLFDPVRKHPITATFLVPTMIYVLLDHPGNEVPVGEVGEICVRGPLVMKSYRNKPDEKALRARYWSGQQRGVH